MHFDSLGRGDACVLNTSACAPWASHLIAFENMHFGPDFAWPREQTNVWAASGAALQAAVIRNGNYVSASMSAFVASRDSCEQLVRGEIKECELLPWDHDKTNGQPLLYFASVISRDTEELPFLYSSLAADIEDYLDGAGLQLTHGLAIAASAL